MQLKSLANLWPTLIWPKKETDQQLEKISVNVNKHKDYAAVKGKGKQN